MKRFFCTLSIAKHKVSENRAFLEINCSASLRMILECFWKQWTLGSEVLLEYNVHLEMEHSISGKLLGVGNELLGEQ